MTITQEMIEAAALALDQHVAVPNYQRLEKAAKAALEAAFAEALKSAGLVIAGPDYFRAIDQSALDDFLTASPAEAIERLHLPDFEPVKIEALKTVSTSYAFLDDQGTINQYPTEAEAIAAAEKMKGNENAE